MNRNIKAIISDWDDTKVATFSSVFDFYKSFSASENLEAPTMNTIRLYWGKTMSQLLQGLWPTLELPVLEEKFWGYVKKVDFAIKPFPYTERTIRRLKKNGYILGVISTGPKKGMHDTLRKYFQLPEDTYTFFFSGDDTPFHKPDPRVFDKALEILQQMKIVKEDVLYVGDSLIDYAAAKNRGILFYAVTSGFTTKEQFIQNGLEEKYILNNFGELPDRV